MSGHVLVAPDKFKGSLTAAEAAEAIAAGLRDADPGLPVVLLPVADGGDGTVDAAVAAGFARRHATVTGPAGTPVRASYAVSGTTAVVELAEASGLKRLAPGEFHPLTASSLGTGELVAAALRGGATRIVLGLGGSACTDGGTGFLTALGARFLDATGTPLPPGGGALRDLAAIEPGPVPDAQIIVASDVDNPLLGPHGAATTFAPQKGASPQDVHALEASLTNLTRLTHPALGSGAEGSADHPGAGAAGGVGFAALAYLGAELRPGIAYLLDLLGFAAKVDGARLVITGEGSLDPQTLRGKAPVGVARAAAAAGVPVIALAGRRALGRDEARAAGFRAVHALTDLGADPARLMPEAATLLRRLAADAVRDMPDFR
ncbi:glycerate kinase [Actinomadura flavalba]|uniref:glycerate kinase n=1 Tax=Actinomadura flavalba TaxID=1120938 RepID=UPI000527125C|nr:glycerate kinase [Actinomadura flavalba]